MADFATDRLSDPTHRGRPLGSDAGRPFASTLAGDLTFAWTALLARRKLIAACVIAAVLCAVGYIWTTPPLYTASAQILIDPRKREIVKQEIVPSGLGTSSLGADTFLLDSQIEVMLSQGVLRSLIERQRLATEGEFASSEGNAVVGAIKSVLKLILRGPQASRVPQMSAVDRVLKALDKRLSIRREGNTYMISVSMTAEDPVKAADIANALTQIYIEESIATSRQRVEQAETLLSGRLAELRSAAVAAQQKVETFRAENGLIAADKIPIVEQELRDLNQQLTVAAANTSRALARWNEVSKLKKLPFEQALSAGSIQSNLLATLQDRYAAVAAQEASLATSLKARHPNMIAVRDSKEALKREISLELARLVSRSKVEHDVAVANEAAIRSRLATAKSATVETNQAAITLKELEQDAQAAMAIYQEFLSRSKDAREQISLPSDSVRIVSTAYPPTRPSWPTEPLLLAFAVFIGVVGGVALAALLHLLKGPPRSVPAYRIPESRRLV